MSTREILRLEDMLAAASTEAGLEDFGSDEFREPLQRLIDSTNDSPFPLSELGSAAFKGEVQRMLVNRLRFARDLKAHPEILDEDVDDPIVIIGMARTGTTKLQRFLAADPDVQRLEYWRIFNPAPFDNNAHHATPGQEDPRKEAARQAVAMMAQLMPNWLDSHPTDADDVDEEVFLQLYTFKCKMHYLLRPVPSYQDWLRTQPLNDTYAYTKRLLQYLQWQDGGKRKRPWILKSPIHLGNLDTLLDTFPKAILICPHRDMHQVIPSMCQLMANTRQLYLGHCDPHEVGRACLDSFASDMKHHLRLREQMQERLDILDLRYEDIRDDALGTARRVYAHAGRELTPRRQQAMLAWERSHPPRRSPGCGYRMEDYGLSAASIDAAFEEYIARFIRGGVAT